MNWLLLPKSSGSVTTTECNDFAKVPDKLEADGVMIVTKLDRLGQNVIDVRATIDPALK
jgi:putative DNA-invertase from lambdoid prophage Rac